MIMPKGTLCAVDYNGCTDLIYTNNIGEQFFICLLTEPFRKGTYDHVVAWQADVAELECYDPIGEPMWLEGVGKTDIHDWKIGNDDGYLLERCRDKFDK